MDAFRSKDASSRIGQVGRRFSLAAQRAAHDAHLRLRAMQQWPPRMLTIRVRFPRLRHWTWDLKQGRKVTVGLIGGCIGALVVIGFLAATDANYSPVSPLGQAFTVQVSDSGVPYVAIDPDAVGQSGSEPTQANGSPPGRGRGGPSPILLFPLGGNLTFGGESPPPGGTPGPSPDPQPKPGPSPSPSPTPYPSPGPSPSPTPGPFGLPGPFALAGPFGLTAAVTRAFAFPGDFALAGAFTLPEAHEAAEAAEAFALA